MFVAGQDYVDHLGELLTTARRAGLYAVEGWTFDVDTMMGTLCWTRGRIMVYASPWFEGCDGMPVNVFDDGGFSPLDPFTLPFRATGDLNVDLVTYVEKMRHLLALLADVEPTPIT
jgi:hypothetical protein